jgi:cytochrome c oxidase cbb3-type subunit 2
MPAESRTQTASSLLEGWQGVFLVASTYVYFLIFAQFGFLKRLAELGIRDTSLPPIMGAMAIGGIGMSLLAPRTRLWNCPSCRLQAGLIGCALAASWSLLPLGILTAIAVSFTIGLSLGLLTITLVANLPLWTGMHRPLLKIALGTGLGYFLCNFPPLFMATPRVIALSAAGCCLLALIVANRSRLYYDPRVQSESKSGKPVPFGLVLMWFTALVWLDSAAFYIIQNSPLLKAGTWQGDLHLWRAGLLHLVAALLSAWLLTRRGVSVTLAIALAVLGLACLFLLDPARVPMAAVLYPIGVSLYSVTLVAYPSFLMPATSQGVRGRRAGSLYALAGWVGSAMGIGMARNLHHVPVTFVAAAAGLFVLPWIWNAIRSGRIGRSELLQAPVVAVVLLVAFGVYQYVCSVKRPSANTTALTAAERGRRIYIAEGCINCHSQYVRPHTADVLMWGPVGNLEAIRAEKPPLIGNRRQGPDLSEVGDRRSPLWLRIHFENPRDVSYHSIMPRFDYLFHDRRGDDLIAYLSSLDDPGHWTEAVENWRPSQAAQEEAKSIDGSKLFAQHCATCHMPGGMVRTKWSASFRRLPPNLSHDALRHVPAQVTPAELRADIAQIVKFGVKGTDMAGHEYLPGAQIAALADYVAAQRKTAPK